MPIITKKQMSDLKQVHEIQGSRGNWDYDQYMLGMFNGMELMLAIIQNREPKYREGPKKQSPLQRVEKWLKNRYERQQRKLHPFLRDEKIKPIWDKPKKKGATNGRKKAATKR